MKLKLEHGTSNASGVTLACPGRCNLAVTGSPCRPARTRAPVAAAPVAPVAPHGTLLPLLTSCSKTNQVTSFPRPGMERWDGPVLRSQALCTQSSQFGVGMGQPPRSIPGCGVVGSGLGLMVLQASRAAPGAAFGGSMQVPLCDASISLPCSHGPEHGWEHGSPPQAQFWPQRQPPGPEHVW